MYDCDLSFDECIEMCTEPIFKETTLEKAMRKPERLPKHFLDAFNYLAETAVKPSNFITKFSNPKPGLEDPHGKTIKFRRYPSVGSKREPVIEGRIPSNWLLDNHHRISEEDFYNAELTEEDLKRKYGSTEGRD